MANFVDASPLGQKTAYISTYDASLLFPIPRIESRKSLGLISALPFYGVDIWTGYEISWLNLKGKPQVAVAEFSIPFDSPNIIESKSFKLYLNSFNQSKFASLEDVKALLLKDLSSAAAANIDLSLRGLNESSLHISSELDSVCIDDLDVVVDDYRPNPSILVADNTIILNEKLCSHLLKSNCPVTGQPDWASLFIEYTGPKIAQESLLKYIVSFREHQDFHEHCVERIFMDLQTYCKPESLSVYARYTRRGGLDINPFRSSNKNERPKIGRLLRQ